MPRCRQRHAGLATRSRASTYRYADPYSCDCLYVGDEQAYAEYKRLAVEKQVAEERLEAAEAEESAAMDWGLWGPWW